MKKIRSRLRVAGAPAGLRASGRGDGVAVHAGVAGAAGGAGDFGADDKQTIGVEKEVAIHKASVSRMGSLSQEFFTETFDPIEATLKSLPETLDQLYVERLLEFYHGVFNEVTSKLGEYVMASYNEFVDGMARVHELGVDLQASTALCQESRRRLESAKHELAEKSFALLSQYRRREMLVEAIEVLKALQTLSHMEQQIQRATEHEDFTTAISSCLECRSVIPAFGELAAVRGINSSLQERYEEVRRRLDVQLMRVCRRFDPLLYEKTLEAYRLLGRVSAMLSRVQQHFMALIAKTAHAVCVQHVLLGQTDRYSEAQLKKMKSRKLVELLAPSAYAPCTVKLLEMFSSLLFQQQAMQYWHSEQAEREDVSHEQAEILVRIADALAHFVPDFFDAMQRELAVLLVAANFARFRVEDFLAIFHSVNKFIEIGEGLAHTAPASLRSSIRKQSKSYFDAFHRQRIEDMRAMLENEMWERCPVPKGWSLHEVKELRAVLSFRPRRRRAGAGAAPDAFYREYLRDGNPFQTDAGDVGADAQQLLRLRTEAPDSAGLDDETENPELDAESIDEEHVGQSGKAAASRDTGVKVDMGAYVLTTSTLNVVRVYGRYLSLMQTLGPLAGDIFGALVQLFEFQLLTVFSFFGPVLSDLNGDTAPGVGDLVVAVMEMQRHLTQDSLSGPVELPALSARVSVHSADTLFGLNERSAAMESLMFTSQVFEAVRSTVVGLVPDTLVAQVATFYKNRVGIVRYLRRATYRLLAALLLNAEPWMHQIAAMRWDVREVSTGHSAYVDTILKEIQAFGLRLKSAGVTEPVQDMLWSYGIEHAMDSLVEAYARVRKCSDAGRGQMQSDVENLKRALMKLTVMRPLPHLDYLLVYLKAYYLSEAVFLDWAREHTEFTEKQLIALVNVGHAGQAMKRKAKTDMIHAIEEIQARRSAARLM